MYSSVYSDSSYVILLLRSYSQTQISQANTEDLRQKLEDRRVVLKSGMAEGEDVLEPQRKKQKMGVDRKDVLITVMSQFFTELAKN